MAFTKGGATFSRRHLLLVADGGKSDRNDRGAVHVIDVVRGTHVGYVAAPGAITRPKAVATRESLAAVCCAQAGTYVPLVRVFEGSSGVDDDCTWTPVRVIAAAAALSLRFTADGSRLVVLWDNWRVSMFSAKEGSFLRRMALPPDVDPIHIEECDH